MGFSSSTSLPVAIFHLQIVLQTAIPLAPYLAHLRPRSSAGSPKCLLHCSGQRLQHGGSRHYFFLRSTLVRFGFCSSLVFNALCKGTFTIGRQHLHSTSHLTYILSSPFNCIPLLLCLPCVLSLLNSACFNYLTVATWPLPHSPLQLSDLKPFAGSRERSCAPCLQLPPKPCQAKC